MSALIFIVAATVFGLLALRYGAESRPGFDERAPGDPLRRAALTAPARLPPGRQPS